MQPLTPEAIWSLNETELYTLLDSEILKPRQNTIRFYAPASPTTKPNIIAHQKASFQPYRSQVTPAQ
jgi:hypothetical protein